MPNYIRSSAILGEMVYMQPFVGKTILPTLPKIWGLTTLGRIGLDPRRGSMGFGARSVKPEVAVATRTCLADRRGSSRNQRADLF